MWRSKKGRCKAAKWKGMTQPWSLVRLLVMIFLILLICPESCQAMEAEECLFHSLNVPLFLNKHPSCMHFKWGAENLYIHSQVCYLLTWRKLCFSCLKEFLSVCFLAVVGICRVKSGHNLFHSPLATASSSSTSSIRLQWAITALLGVDTFSCSSICGVVINFLSVIGLSYNILRLEAAWSPAINYKT